MYKHLKLFIASGALLACTPLMAHANHDALPFMHKLLHLLTSNAHLLPIVGALSIILVFAAGAWKLSRARHTSQSEKAIIRRVY